MQAEAQEDMCTSRSQVASGSRQVFGAGAVWLCLGQEASSG